MTFQALVPAFVAFSATLTAGQGVTGQCHLTMPLNVSLSKTLSGNGMRERSLSKNDGRTAGSRARSACQIAESRHP